MRLDGRLAALAAMVRQGARVADIGTDHAHLPIFLVQSGKSPHAIACDVQAKPLAVAAQRIARYHLQAHIAVRLADGLQGIAPHEADDIIIAGMGGELIARILADTPWLAQTPPIRLILQPMTRPEALRAMLCTHGFAILREQAVQEGRRVYTVMQAQYTGECPQRESAYMYMGELPRALDAAGRAFLQKQLERLQKQRLGLRDAPAIHKADAIIAGLRRVLESCE